MGHCVAGTYLWCGTAEVVAETGEKALFAALNRLWCSATLRRMHVTGGVGAFHRSTSARGDFIGECFGED